MTRQKILVAALVPALAVMTLSACNRAPADANAQGAVNTTPAAVQQSGTMPAQTTPAETAPAETPQVAVEPAMTAAPAAPAVEYADVTRVKPVTVKETIYGTVTGSNEITSQSTQSHQVCADVVVQDRLPERDGNVGGTVAGAVIGGVIGNQVGKGNGRKAATLAGAVAGGFAGHAIDKRSDNGKVVSRTEQQCHDEDQAVSNVIGYDVNYRKSNGSTGSMRMDNAPARGSRIALGSTQKTVGYDVTYKYAGRQSTVRMNSKPGDQLTVVDGKVVTQSAPVNRG